MVTRAEKIVVRLIGTVCLWLAVCPRPVTAQSLPFGGETSGVVIPTDPFQGDYHGAWQATKGFLRQNPEIVAQVITRGRGAYEIVFHGEFDKRSTPYARVRGGVENGQLKFDGDGFSGRIQNGKMIGQGTLRANQGEFQLNKVVRRSPRLGAAPPTGARVLFDGTTLDQWVAKGKGDDPQWTIVDGVLCTAQVPRQSLATRDPFGDFLLHVEFRLPIEPENTGQGRANSGVLIGPYEVQILDSYGLEGYDNECGAIYKTYAPKMNMCSPPGQWQTYDITFHPPRFDGQGYKTASARMTVDHNGKLIHHDVEVPHTTGASQRSRKTTFELPGPYHISLQNHGGHPIQFRNIWIVPPAPTADGDR